MLEVQVVTFFKPVVRDSLVYDVLLWSILKDIVVWEASHACVSQSCSVENLVPECSIHLYGDIVILVSETDV